MSEKIRECPVPHSFADPTPPGLDCDSEFGHYVHCAECGAFGPYSETGAGAIAAWNLRPREERLVKLLREADNALDLIMDDQCVCRSCHEKAHEVCTAIDAELVRAAKEET